jgi:p-aminobenzoyl-glutamate transporter AbgT
MASYIVLAFAAAQFVSYLPGRTSAPSSPSPRRPAQTSTSRAPMLAAFVLFAATLNLLITSASAKGDHR